MATNFVQIENDWEIKKRLEAERMRLRKIAGLDQPSHFHRPIERAFTAQERSHVTILFGGFTWKHEDLIRAVFLGSGAIVAGAGTNIGEGTYERIPR